MKVDGLDLLSLREKMLGLSTKLESALSTNEAGGKGETRAKSKHEEQVSVLSSVVTKTKPLLRKWIWTDKIQTQSGARPDLEAKIRQVWSVGLGPVQELQDRCPHPRDNKEVRSFCAFMQKSFLGSRVSCVAQAGLKFLGLKYSSSWD